MFILEAENLVKTFGKLKAVDQVSLRLKEGECTAFLGPNGAGKTTTVEILEGLQKADSGSVKIFGLDFSTHKKAILEKTGVLLQETYLYKKLTVRETLELFASFYKKPASVDEMLERVELRDKAHTRLEQLSGGQKQRVYLACGLINRPALFFLDEPTTGLDPQARRMIWSLLEDLKKDGCSLLLTTHYMEEAEVLADNVLIIDHGKIIAEGSPEELVRTHCGEGIFILELEDPSRFDEVATTMKEILREPVEISRPAENRLAVHSSSSFATMRQVMNHFEGEASPFVGLQMKKSNLEDVFLKLTGRSMRDA